MIIHHQIAIYSSVERVYEIISKTENIGRWWDEQTEVETDQGLVLEHNPGKEHGVVKLKVTSQIPNNRVEWECISSHPNSSPASVWTGTHFIFELTKEDTPSSAILQSCPDFKGQEICTLNFFQTKYDDLSEFLGFNNFAWAQVLNCLKTVCESEGTIS